MSRVPVRLRLTLALAVATAVVLAGLGAFLYVRLGDSLLEQLDESLQARAATLAALVADGGGLDARVLAAGDEDVVAQILRPDGSLLVSAPTVTGAPLLSGDELPRSGPRLLTVDAMPGLDGEQARLLAQPLAGADGPVVLVVGGSLEDREEALAGLLTALFVVGPLALLLASLAGYLLAAAALRPVEAMRRRATEISGEQPGRRLPLPPATDEIRRLGETLNEMLHRLEEGRERERRFLADASHELRTPLSLLQAELELALRRPRSRDELGAALRSAAEEADRLTRLAEDLLTLTQLDERGAPLRLEPVAPADLLAAVARRFAARADASGRGLAVDARAAGFVAWDRLRLERALGTLVDNALRHGSGAVRLTADRHDGLVDLTVSDQGDGFPDDFLLRAFERFSRADEARTAGAAGLGLAIVDAVARSHGGEATAANGDTGGAVVTLRLPATPVQRGGLVRGFPED
jgi:heavy metal sensor kinase